MIIFCFNLLVFGSVCLPSLNPSKINNDIKISNNVFWFITKLNLVLVSFYLFFFLLSCFPYKNLLRNINDSIVIIYWIDNNRFLKIFEFQVFWKLLNSLKIFYIVNKNKKEVRCLILTDPIFFFCFFLFLFHPHITHIKNTTTDKVLATLGEGTFGRVVKVKDMER